MHQPASRLLTLAVASAACLALTACGGGDAESEAADAGTAPTRQAQADDRNPPPPASGTPGATTTQALAQIVAAMPPNSWKALPNTKMKDVCPTPYNAYACESVVAAWSGADFDQRRDRMVVYGGGHGDSWYNNLFVFDLGTLSWQRLTEMSAGATGSKPGAGWNDSRLESCGFYPKAAPVLPPEVMKGAYVDYAKCFTEPVRSQLDLQQPRSSHTYGKVFVDRLNDRYCYLGGSYYPGAQTQSPAVVCYDLARRQWRHVADRPPAALGRGDTALDAAGKVWYLTAEGGHVTRYDPVGNGWQTYGYLNYQAGGGADIDRRRNQFHVLVQLADGRHVLRRWNLNSADSLRARPTYAEPAVTGTAPSGVGPRPGMVYADARDRFFLWGGGRDVYSLDPATLDWRRHTATGDDPGPQQRWGTYGRLRYSTRHGVLVLVNKTTQDVFIYKPEAPWTSAGSTR